ncbi:hypothetical protein CC80DRAFT_490525 [Byssothecium circinans]|uniref:Mediator of RNA polymerase II transcription subunit 8 n=1 Tax=Byssothecium circinans TaxID=147558 RepID=A0A6A5U238_9PLEO|nr:hypothetical protein CC80DRAFT_490525 [Byssothecium circinans]
MNQPQNQVSAMAGQLGPVEISALNALRSKLLPLVYQLSNMQNEMANPVKPPDWPSIQRSTASVNTLITSIQTLLTDDPETTKIFASLHPYPISPYPTSDPLLSNIATTHLRKTLEVHDQDWVTDRLAKASEFAHVPEDWGIEPRKPKEEKEDDVSDDREDDMSRKVKRVKGALNEDQIAELWGQGADIVEEEMEHVGAQTGSGSGSEEEEEEDEDEEMEGTDVKGDTSVAKAKSVVAQPLMPLEVLHKFMMVGAVVEVPRFQPPA